MMKRFPMDSREEQSPLDGLSAGRRPAPGAPRPDRRKLAGWAVGIAVLLSKGKGLLALVKFLPSLASIFLSIAVYAQAWGWPFAAGFVLLIFVHETGHLIEMKRLGLAAGAPVFIPFVGAVIAMKGMPRNAYIEARVGLAGPLLGSLGAVALLPFAANRPLLAALAHVGILINLFNLIPLSPLDGGRIAGALSSLFSVVGILMLLAVFLLTGSMLVLIILVVGALGAWKRFRHPIPGYQDIPGLQRAAIGSLYLGLSATLVFLLIAGPRPSREALVAGGLYGAWEWIRQMVRWRRHPAPA